MCCIPLCDTASCPRRSNLRYANLYKAHTPFDFLNQHRQHMMNTVFRVAGEFNHLLSLVLLIHHIRTRKSSVGISFQTQCLYLVAHIGQLIGNKHLSLWNWSNPGLFFATSVQILFILLSAHILYLMTRVYTTDPAPKVDSVRSIFFILGAFIMALFFNSEFEFGSLFNGLYGWYYIFAFLAVFYTCI